MTSPQAEKTAGKTMTHDNIRAALAELVALKDLKERFIKFNPQFHWTPEQEREYAGMMLDYERRQPLAWAAARSALSASTQPEGRGERAAFEAWALSDPDPLDVFMKDGIYTDDDTSRCWAGWEARAKRATPPDRAAANAEGRDLVSEIVAALKAEDWPITPCCGEYAICHRPCTPRGRWEGARAAQAGREEVAPETLRGLDTPTRVRFYEHDFYVLSNFSAFRLRWRDIDFDTSEHAYHCEKFFSTVVGIAHEIQGAGSAHEAFKIAERNKHYRRADWDEVKVGIMREILRAKAAQHEYVRRKLLVTGDRELVEDSWRDDFWGWGPNRDGKNMLGKLWMEVRAELRAASPSPAAAQGEKT